METGSETTLDLRLLSALREVLEQAADHLGQSADQFAVGVLARTAREVIEQARQVAGGFSRLEDKEGAMPYVAEAMAEIGDLDGALALVRTLAKHGQYNGFQRIIKAHTEEIAGVGPNLDGIPITLGAESMKVKDRATTRQAMPKIAQAVRDCGDALFQARTLAIIAHLQAKAGDFAGARQTADSIPKIKRGDFPGPSDGFYDAIKPGILALMARAQFDAAIKRTREAPSSEGKAVAGVLLPDLLGPMAAQARLERQLAALRVIEALRMYAAGHGSELPDKVADVTEVPAPDDPVTGRPFEYSRDGETGTLVSRQVPDHRRPIPGLRYRVTIRKK